MDCESHSIVSTVVVDKREVNLRSPNMENVALERSLTLLPDTLQTAELVTLLDNNNMTTLMPAHSVLE